MLVGVVGGGARALGIEGAHCAEAGVDLGDVGQELVEQGAAGYLAAAQGGELFTGGGGRGAETYAKSSQLGGWRPRG